MLGRKNKDSKNYFSIFESCRDNPFNPWLSRYFPNNTQLYPELITVTKYGLLKYGQIQPTNEINRLFKRKYRKKKKYVFFLSSWAK